MKSREFTAGEFVTNLDVRIPEDEEIITGLEGIFYANREDNRTLNYSMVAYDILERLKPSKQDSILEVCCGSGQLAHFLYQISANDNIVATDGSPELIQAAQERYEHNSVKFETHDIYEHPYKRRNRIVVCKDSFHHFKDPVKAIKSLLGLVSSDGVLYIYDLARECPANQIEKRLATMQNPHEQERFLKSINATFTDEEMTTIFKEAEANKFNAIYPLRFSERNLSHHAKEIENDETKEHLLDKLSRIYLISP